MTATDRKLQMSRGDRFAEAVSTVFHPFVIVIPTMVIAMLRKGIPLGHSLLWTSLAVIVMILPLVFLIYSGVRSGRYSDPSVSIREQRRTLYVVDIFFLVLLLAILVWWNAPLILVACLVAAIFSTLFASVINYRFTKLSLHSFSMAGCAMVLILTAPALGAAMVLFVPLVAWARIRLRHHTPLQILIGWTVSAVCVLIVFRVFRLMP